MSERRALVTGATGFIGSHLVPALLTGGWAVRACGRRPRPAWLSAEVDYRSVDLGRPDGLDVLVRGISHVFHLAGASSSTADEQEMQRSNVAATQNLLAAARRADLVRVLYMSSTSVYGEEVQLSVPVPEDVQPHPSRAYGKAKWGAEQEVWAQGDAGLPVVVLRPVSVFGPGNVKLVGSAVLDTAIEAWAGRGSLAVAETPVEQRLVHIEDLVAASLHLATHDGAAGRAYNVVADTYPSSHEVAHVLAGAFGMEVELGDGADLGLAFDERRAVRDEMLQAGMAPHILLTEQRFRFMGKVNPNNRLRIDALRGTGFRFAQDDLLAAIARTVDWYLEHRWIVTR